MWKFLSTLLVSAACTSAAHAFAPFSPDPVPPFAVSGDGLVCREDVFAEMVQFEEVLIPDVLRRINRTYAHEGLMCVYTPYIAIIHDSRFRMFTHDGEGFFVQRVGIIAFRDDDRLVYVSRAQNRGYVVVPISRRKR